MTAGAVVKKIRELFPWVPKPVPPDVKVELEVKFKVLFADRVRLAKVASAETKAPAVPVPPVDTMTVFEPWVEVRAPNVSVASEFSRP
jgi:hypothetical protein